MASEKDKKNFVGCAVSMVYIFVAYPMWFYLVFTILTAIEATGQQWALFYVYIAISWLIVLFKSVVEVVFED